MSDNLPDVAETIRALRAVHRDHFDFGEPSVFKDAAQMLGSLSARVTQAETELAQAKHDAWQEGFDRGEQDVLDHERHGWDDSCDVENPYPAPVSGIADQKDEAHD